MKRMKTKAENLRRFIEKTKKPRLVTLTCIERQSIFEMIYGFENKELLLLSIELPKKNPEIESIMDIYPGAELYEREIHESFDIDFKNNPFQHSRLFLPENWPKKKHPMLKGGKNA